jgi:hypothetical protein
MTTDDDATGVHEPPIWRELRAHIRNNSGKNVTLICGCSWDEIRSLKDDAFRDRVAESDAYAAFFVRALIGNPDDWPADNCITIEPNGDSNVLSIPAALVPPMNVLTDEYFVGADLVARIALGVANRICNTTGCSFTPRLDCFTSSDGGNAQELRFLSADFLVAKVHSTLEIDGIANGCCPSHYHHFGWVDGKPPRESWINHGWRMKSDREFTNDPNAPKRNGEIETFLGFPAFFRHSEAQVIVAFPTSGASRQTPSCDSHRILSLQGIEPYLNLKEQEFNTRAKAIDAKKGCIVLCLGVSDQRAAFFDPSKFNWAYGVFLTIDLELPGRNQFGNTECVDDEFLSTVIKDLEGMRFEIKYTTLQVLTGRLLNELDERNRSLEKSRQMLQQLNGPLKSLSDALGKTQAEAQEIRAILYEPMEAIFALVPRIAEFFEQNRRINNPDRSTTRISHQPSNYSLADARWVLAHVLATFRGREILTKTSEDALAEEIDALSKASQDGASAFQQLSVTTLRLIDYAPPDSLDPIKALERVKERLFSPFKPDNGLRAIEGDAIAALLPAEARITYAYDETTFRMSEVIPEGLNPFATQGHLLRFISGVVSATFNASEGGCKRFVISADQDGLTIKREDMHPWVTAENISQLFKVLAREVSNFNKASRALEENWGDRAAPFVRLLRRLPPEYRSDALKVSKDHDDQIYKIGLGRKVTLERTGDGVVITIEQLRISYDEVFYVGRSV